METPFDKTIAWLWNKQMNSSFTDEDLSYYQMFKLLRMIYLRMCEVDLKKDMELKKCDQGPKPLTVEYILDYGASGSKIYLDYITFINHLNIFGGILKSNSIEMILFERIKFYRNKVSEHWAEYINYQDFGSLSQGDGKIALPIHSGTVSLLKKREEAKVELITKFKEKGITIEIGEAYNNISVLTNYADTIFNGLEQIKKFPWSQDDNKTNKDLIALIFRLGFPLPIYDIQEYSKQLVVSINTRLGVV